MKILLATDGSDTARAAGDFLLKFPSPAGSEVELLNVIRDTYFKSEEWEDWQGLDDEQRAELEEAEQLERKGREELVAEEAERLRSAGWTSSTEIRTGQPANEIVRAAGKFGANLIVLGSVGTSGTRGFHLGRVCSTVLEYAPVSVLVAKPPTAEATPSTGSEKPPFRLLIAFDGSQSARKAVEFCQSLPLDEQSEVHVLGVLRLIRGFRQDVQQRLSKVWQQKKTAAKAALDEVVKDEGWATPHVSSELREGSSVTEAIMHVAEKTHSDLIVLGDKGKSSVESFLLGSATRRIPRHAPCPVLTVRA